MCLFYPLWLAMLASFCCCFIVADEDLRMRREQEYYDRQGRTYVVVKHVESAPSTNAPTSI